MSKKKTKKTTDATTTEPAADAAPTTEPAADAAPTTEPAADAAPTTEPTTEPAAAPKARSADRMPPAGTVLQKIGKGGIVRGECRIADDGVHVEYNGKVYNSLSGAAMAHIKDLGLATSAVDGFAWWGLKKRERVEGGAATPRAPRTANLTARKEKLTARIAKLTEEIGKLNAEIVDLDAKIVAAVAASPEGKEQAKVEQQASALANV